MAKKSMSRLTCRSSSAVRKGAPGVRPGLRARSLRPRFRPWPADRSGPKPGPGSWPGSAWRDVRLAGLAADLACDAHALGALGDDGMREAARPRPAVGQDRRIGDVAH